MLGNASEEGGVLKEEFLVPLSLFSPLLPPLLLSPFTSLSHSLFLSFPLSFSFLRFFSILRGLLVLFIPEMKGMALLIVINCTFIVIKNNIFFLEHEFVYSDVCNFLVHSLAKLSVFLLPRCPSFLFMRTLNKIINKHIDRHLKADDTLLKITIRGLLIKTLKVLSVPRMRQNFSFFRLEFVITRFDDARYDIGAFPVGPQFSMCWIFPRR